MSIPRILIFSLSRSTEEERVSKKFLLVISTIFFTTDFLSAGTALAEGGHSVGLSSLFWPATNFFIYVGLLTYFYRKHGTKALRARSVSIEEHVNRASASLADAEAKYQNSSERLQNIAAEKSELVEDYRLEGERMYQIILEQASENAARIARDSGRLIASELSRAEKEIKNQVLLTATERVRVRLSSELSAEDDKALRRRALESLA